MCILLHPTLHLLDAKVLTMNFEDDNFVDSQPWKLQKLNPLKFVLIWYVSTLPAVATEVDLQVVTTSNNY